MQKKRTCKPYKTLIGWQEVEDYTRRDGTRSLNRLAIGESREESYVDYIFEDIYSDILEDLKENFHAYQIYVKIGNIPQLIITLNDTLIIHNPEIKEMAGRVKQILTDIPNEYIVNAYVEMRLNNENKAKLGNSTKLLVSMVNAIDNTKYPVPFIQSVIKEMIEQNYFDTTDSSIKEYIRSLEYNEIILVIGDIHRFKATKKMEDSFLFEKIEAEEISIKDLEVIVGKELIYRLYTGSIIGR